MEQEWVGEKSEGLAMGLRVKRLELASIGQTINDATHNHILTLAIC